MVAGTVALAALGALVATGWLSGVMLVALTVPLPALYDTESMRVAAVAPVTAVAVGAWLLALGVAGRTARLGRTPKNTLALLFATFVIATVTAQYALTSVRETINFAFLLGFLLMAADAFADRRALPQVVDLLVASAAVCGVLALLETVGILPAQFPRYNTNYNRAALGFGQPNALGLFMAMVLPFAVHRFRIERDRVYKTLCALACLGVATGLIASFSRGSWLSVLAGTGALFFTGDGKLARRIWLSAILLVVVVDLASGGAMRDTAVRTIGDWVIEQRAALMLAGIAMFLAYPVTGVGPGGYAESLDRFGPQIPQLWDYLPTPHNAYVHMAAENGILGLIAFLVFIVITFRVQVRRTRRDDADAVVTREERSLNRALIWSFGTAVAAGMVVWPFAHGTGQALMLVTAGIYAMPRRG
jgi:O-antigen ligase